MCKILEQYSDKIKGTFSFFDRMIINGYINPLMNEHSRIGSLCQLGVLYKDFKSYFMSVTESIKNKLKMVPPYWDARLNTFHPQKQEKKMSQNAYWKNPLLMMA